MAKRSRNATSSSTSVASSSATSSATPAEMNVRFQPGDIVLCQEMPIKLINKIKTKSSKEGKWEIEWIGFEGTDKRLDKNFIALHKDDRVAEPKIIKYKKIFRVHMPKVMELLRQKSDGWGSEAGRTRDASPFLLEPRTVDVHRVDQTQQVAADPVDEAIPSEAPADVPAVVPADVPAVVPADDFVDFSADSPADIPADIPAEVPAVEPTPPGASITVEGSVCVPAANRLEVQQLIDETTRIGSSRQARKRAGSQLNGNSFKKSKNTAEGDEVDPSQQASGWLSSFGNAFATAKNWASGLFSKH